MDTLLIAIVLFAVAGLAFMGIVMVGGRFDPD